MEEGGRSILLNNFYGYFVVTKSLSYFQLHLAFFESPSTQADRNFGSGATRRGLLIEPLSVQIP
jgi:hypothetical protein